MRREAMIDAKKAAAMLGVGRDTAADMLRAGLLQGWSNGEDGKARRYSISLSSVKELAAARADFRRAHISVSQLAAGLGISLSRAAVLARRRGFVNLPPCMAGDRSGYIKREHMDALINARQRALAPSAPTASAPSAPTSVESTEPAVRVVERVDHVLSPLALEALALRENTRASREVRDAVRALVAAIGELGADVTHLRQAIALFHRDMCAPAAEKSSSNGTGDTH